MKIRLATAEDIESLERLTLAEGYAKEEGYFERCMDEHSPDFREVFLIADDGAAPRGYCLYNCNPRYQPFRSLGIPEIQDLYVHKDFRGQGYATALIEYCCDKAGHENKDMIGIGVGLYASYGKAQRLYFKMGFIPDGGGIVYERKAVQPGQVYRVDDELCLMLIKDLSPDGEINE